MSDSKKQPKAAETAAKADRKAAKKKKKLDASLKNLSAKQRREALQERKEKHRTHIYIGIGVVVVILVAALLFWDGGTIQKHAAAMTVGEKSYSAVDLDYYYYSQYNNVYSYASYYGLDTSVSLKEQEAYDGTSWYEYLRNAAKTSLTGVSMLAQEAEAAGYEISEDGQANIDEAMDSLDEACETYGVTANYYLSQMFGRYMTKSRYEKILTEYYYAYDYEDYKTNSFEVTDDEINDYYSENKDTLDTYDIDAYYIDATVDTQYDDDGNEMEATEEDTQAAVDAAKEYADQLEAAVKSSDEDKIAKLVEASEATDRSASEGSSVNSFTYADWVMSGDRKAGDVTTIASTTGSDEDEEIQGYYVVRFNGRARDDYYPVNIRNILVYADEADSEDEDAEITYDYGAAKTTIDEIAADWQSSGGSEEDFAALTEENSSDSSSNGNGGLYESVTHGQFDDAVNEWIFDKDRKAGDYEIIKDETNTGYQLIYFVGTDDLYAWQETAKSSLQSTAYDDWYNDTIENYEAKTTFMYRFVG